jgi:subtilisin family serine protease
MKPWWVWCVCLPLGAATIPGRYIVELSTEPVAARVASMGKRGLLSQTAVAHRAAIRAEHNRARTAFGAHKATVLESMDTVVNALVVQVPDSEAAALASVPGVKSVRQERVFHLVLDHALPLHKVPDAWNMVGYDNAGAGMKIAFIDTGIDVGHPGFQDASLTIPDGYPKVNAATDTVYTNNKVIVARSYASLWPNRDPDRSARDRVGHGTATAMAAGGVPNAGPLATISGVAPKAWLGSYKVFGSPGVNDGASESGILKALDDAVADGMDVINISLGSDLAPLPGNDPEVTAVEQAAALGVIVVVASGNNGPDPATVGSPASAPSVIAVGASDNDRIFAATADLSNGASYVALPGSGAAATSGPVTAPIGDVASLDGDGMACGALPSNSLQGRIALILRGVCTFEQKIVAVQNAGAVAALVYTDASRPNPIAMSTGSAAIPAEMVSYSDGVAVKASLTSSATATLDFAQHAMSTSADALAGFSSKGPNLDGAIKPDMVAVGSNIYTATQKFDSTGELYDASGYAVFDGTSFSAPIVAGAAALVKAARPGLTAAQYRSLLIDNAARISSAPGAAATVQQAGGGLLDVSAALRATAAMTPASVSFGAGNGTGSIARSLTIANVGTATETFQLSAVPSAGGPAPSLSVPSLTLDPGASAQVALTFPADALGAGQYEGFLSVTGANSGVESRVPYWYAVPSGVPAYITILDSFTGNLTPGAMVADAVTFHVVDTTGIVMLNVLPAAESVSGGGTVVGLVSRNFTSPGAFSLSVRLSRAPGTNLFRVTAGDVSVDIPLVSQ